MADRQVDRELRGGGLGLSAPDFAVIGGGIVGVSAAAFLAEAGAAVELYERDTVAAAASGRNSGALQHPFDDALLPLHERSLEIYRSVFSLPERPVGILMLAREAAPLAEVAAALERDCPELRAEVVAEGELAALEPSLAPGLAACRLDTGYPVRPAAATLAMAELARRNGATISEGVAARPLVKDGRCTGVVVGREMAGGDVAAGVVAGGEERPAGAVLVAAGPWTPSVVDPGGGWRPIAPIWGVVAEVALRRPPRHVVEEAGVEAASLSEPAALFSLVTADGSSGVGSTFAPGEPDHAAVGPRLREAGAGFVPELRDAPVLSTRACARPQSFDGRPLIGPVSGVEDLHVAAGHGPWGMSLGAASGRLAADALLGRADVPEPLSARRFGGP